MQKKKLFVEIEIPAPIAKRLVSKVSQWQDLPVKWVKPTNLHITVAFIGYVDESVIPEICAAVSEAAQSVESFDIVFEAIELGPDPQNPQMIWATGEPSEGLLALNSAVEKALGMQKSQHKAFRPHITLGRIRKLRWDLLDEKPIISEKIAIHIPVDGISVLESRGGGSEYLALEYCPLA